MVSQSAELGASRATRSLLEKATELAEIGAGLQLAPNAMRVLDWLEVLERIKSAAIFPQTLNLLDIVTAKRLKTVDLGPAFITRYGYPYIVMHRSDLLTILIQACRDSGLVSFETSKEAIVIEDLRDSADITCKDGSVYRTEALIAADGLWSLARRILFSDDQVHTPQYVAYRGTIPISEVAMYACPDDLLIWAGPEMHLVQYPVRGGKLYNQVAVFKSDRYRSDSDDWGTTDELDRHFSAACPYVFEAVNRSAAAAVGRYSTATHHPMGQEQGGPVRERCASDAAVSCAGSVSGSRRRRLHRRLRGSVCA